MTNRIVKLGLIQMKSLKTPAKNLAKAEKNIEQAAKKGAQIVCFSELFLTPYFCQTKNDKFFKLAEKVPGPTTKTLEKIAKKNSIVIVCSIYEKADEKFYNTAAVINADGKYLGKYRKIHIPNDPENGYDEAYYFSPGNLGFQVFQTKYAKIAPMICFDQWFPESARIVADKGAEILFYPTALGWPLSPARPEINLSELNQAEHEAWQIMHRSHAIANNVFVTAINHVGIEGSTNFWGTTMVSDPYGRVIGKASTNKEKNLIVECNLDLIDQMRKDWPFLSARVIKY